MQCLTKQPHLPMRRRRPLTGALGILAMAILLGACASPVSTGLPVTSVPPSPTPSPAPGTAVVYDSLPGVLPPNMPSQPFQAQQTFEFGDYVHLGGSIRALRTVSFVMSDWALAADYPALPSTGWAYPLTCNIYAVIPGVPANHLGALLGSLSQSFVMPWRPAEDPAAPLLYGKHGWTASNGLFYNGFAFKVTFDMTSLELTLPDQVIIGIAYNTQTYGAIPTGLNGPYNSLNVGVEGIATVGRDDDPDRVFWNTITAAWYADQGAAGIGIFREDTNWAAAFAVPSLSSLPIQITAAP